MDVGKSTVRVERENLGLTHSTDLLESDIITFCIYSNEFFFFFFFCGRHCINNTKKLYECKIKLYHFTTFIIKRTMCTCNQ
jgi:hypothetical protein